MAAGEFGIVDLIAFGLQHVAHMPVRNGEVGTVAKGQETIRLKCARFDVEFQCQFLSDGKLPGQPFVLVFPFRFPSERTGLC